MCGLSATLTSGCRKWSVGLRIRNEKSCLLVVDVQSRLLPAIAAPERVVANTAVLIQAARRLNVPILVSEQNPRGLGTTVEALAAMVSPDEVAAKMHFSCLGDDGFGRRLAALGRSQAVVVGIEAHVCVLQTALDLVADDHAVFVVADATGSRAPDNHALAMARLRAAGAAIVSTEMVVFEWLEKAGTPEFRALTALIK